MNKKQIKAKVQALLTAGVGKTAVFRLLSGHGVGDSLLAHYIASHVDVSEVDTHANKIDRLLWIMVAQALLGLWLGWTMAAAWGPVGKGIALLLCAGLPLFFAWGFYKNLAGFYNAYILLQIVQFPKAFKDFNTDPITTLVAGAISLGVLAYVWYLRSKLFPDFLAFSPKKQSGKYVFVT